MEFNERQELKAIEKILAKKSKIRYNPFSDFPPETIEKVLSLLEEYSEEIKPPTNP